MTVYDAGMDAFQRIAAADTVHTPKNDFDYVRAVVDAALAYREPLFDVERTPVRIQLKRTRGWRLPAGAVSCARPHRYGNPFIVGTPENGGNITREQAVTEYEKALVEGRLSYTVADVRADLHGRDLACFCPLDLPCHADVLLRIANT